MRKIHFFVFILVLLSLLVSCSSYKYRAVPVSLPSSQPQHVFVEGVQISGTAYLSRNYAEKRFGFDIRKAGLLPVQIVIDNQGKKGVVIDPLQTFLIDKDGQAWPILPEQEAYRRVKDYTEVGNIAKGTVKPAAILGAAGALVGFAVGVVSGHEVKKDVARGAVAGATIGAIAGGVSSLSGSEEQIRQDLLNRSLQNSVIGPGELVHGFLFFPGKDEALSVKELRLALKIGGKEKVVTVPLMNR